MRLLADGMIYSLLLIKGLVNKSLSRRVLGLTAFFKERGDGSDPRSRNRAIKAEISLERLAEARGVKLKRHGARPDGPVPLPRRSDPVAGDQPREEPLALPGRVPVGRHGERLG